MKELSTRPSTESTTAKVPSPIPPPVATVAASLSPPTKAKETAPQTNSTPKPATTNNNAADLMSLNMSGNENFAASQAAFHQVPFASMGVEGELLNNFFYYLFRIATQQGILRKFLDS